MFEVIPSPGTDNPDWLTIERKIKAVLPFAKTIHIDIFDEKFGARTSFLDPKPFAKYTQDIFFELHMMVANPMQYLQPFADVGFKRFIGHVESFKNPAEQEEFVAKAQSLGEVGLAIDGPTPISMVSVPYQNLDCFLVMTIKAGESGQTFNLQHLDKVKILKQVQDDTGLRFAIEVDGGITDVTLPLTKTAGANRFVSTTFIFNPPADSGPLKQFKLLEERAHQ